MYRRLSRHLEGKHSEEFKKRKFRIGDDMGVFSRFEKGVW